MLSIWQIVRCVRACVMRTVETETGSMPKLSMPAIQKRMAGMLFCGKEQDSAG